MNLGKALVRVNFIMEDGREIQIAVEDREEAEKLKSFWKETDSVKSASVIDASNAHVPDSPE